MVSGGQITIPIVVGRKLLEFCDKYHSAFSSRLCIWIKIDIIQPTTAQAELLDRVGRCTKIIEDDVSPPGVEYLRSSEVMEPLNPIPFGGSAVLQKCLCNGQKPVKRLTNVKI